MNEPLSWLAVFSKLGVPGTAILAVVLAIAGAVGTNVGNVREHVAAFFDYQHNETHYHNSDGNNITNAPSVFQTHEYPEIDRRLSKWLAMLFKFGAPGKLIFTVAMEIASVVITWHIPERVQAFLDYEPPETDYNNSDRNNITNAPSVLTHEHNETHYNNSDGNITNASSVSQTHEHPEIDKRFNEVDERFNKVDGRFNEVDARFNEVEGRLTNLEQGQADIYGRLTNLEQGQAEIKAILQKLLEKP